MSHVTFVQYLPVLNYGEEKKDIVVQCLFLCFDQDYGADYDWLFLIRTQYWPTSGPWSCGPCTCLSGPWAAALSSHLIYYASSDGPYYQRNVGPIRVHLLIYLWGVQSTNAFNHHIRMSIRRRKKTQLSILNWRIS